MDAHESIEDFECHCGGLLRHIPVNINTESSKRITIYARSLYSNKMKQKYFLLRLAGGFIALVGLFWILMFLISLNFFLLVTAQYAVMVLFTGLGIAAYSQEKYINFKKSTHAEKTVARHLKGLPEGYFVFNDLKLPDIKGNIDHLVIGPSGYYIIENENLEGEIIFNEDRFYIKKGGKYKEHPSKSPEHAKYIATRIMKYISSQEVMGVWVKPLIALNNPKLKILEPSDKYEVILPSMLVDYILSQKMNTSAENVKKAAFYFRDKSANYSFVK